MRSGCRCVVLAVWLVAWLSPRVARSDPTAPGVAREEASSSAPFADSAREEARRLYLDGSREVQAGRWILARDHYRRSFGLYPAPSTLVNLALCETELGHLVEGWALLERALALSASTGPPLDPERRHAVQVERDRLRGRFASVRLDGSRSQEVSAGGASIVPVPEEPGAYRLVAASEVAWATLPVGSRIYVDPGVYRFARRAGDATTYYELELSEGESRRLPAPPTDKAEQPPAERTPPTGQLLVPSDGAARAAAPPRAPPSKTRPFRGLGVGSLIVGGAALTTALVSAGVLLDADAKLRDGCSPEGACPTELAGTVERYETAAVVTNAGLISAVAAGALGLVFLTLDSRSTKRSLALQATAADLRLRLRF